MKTKNLSDSQVAEAKAELAKIFRMSVEGISIQMFSGAIDAVWHELLTDPVDYREFCLQACGHVVGHVETKGHGIVTFLEAYERRHGTLPPIWHVDADGVLNEQTKRTYELTGVIEASWDCGPSHACEDAPVKATPEKKRVELAGV